MATVLDVLVMLQVAASSAFLIANRSKSVGMQTTILQSISITDLFPSLSRI